MRASRPLLHPGAATAGDGLGEDRARHDSRRYHSPQLIDNSGDRLPVPRWAIGDGPRLAQPGIWRWAADRWSETAP
jgi:hypothetical protein